MQGVVPSLDQLADVGLDLTVEDSVATVTLSRPARRNAMTPSMWLGLAEIGATLPEQVRVVVVRGEGPAFCAGIDLRLFSPEGVAGEEYEFDPADPRSDQVLASWQAGFTWLRNPQFVSVAAVQGHAIGAGLQLALACDLRVLAEDAKLCIKEPALGLVPDLTGTKPLVDILGMPRAMELCLTARTLNAEEAVLLRLAELVVPAHQLGEAVGDLVAALLSADPAAARATKALLMQAPRNTLEQQAAAERQAQRALLSARQPPGGQ